MSSKKPVQAIRTPSIKTLNKYGLSMAQWMAMAGAGFCHVCGRVPSTGRLVVDHEHVKGYKHMLPTQRRLYVRGLTCWNCNYRYLAKGMSLTVAKKLVDYFIRYIEGHALPRTSP